MGGIFAPAAVMGGFTGFLLSRSINEISAKVGLHESNFTLVGMVVVLDEVRNDMFDTSKYSEPISNFLYSPPSDEKVSVDSDARGILNKFKKTDNYNMVVLDGTKYIGLISRANLLKEYRENMIADIEEI